MKKINGFDVSKFRGFAYDGCHKIYLFKTLKEQKQLKKWGYERMYAVDKGLIQCFLDSCSLRFIQTFGGDDNEKYVSVVPQGCDEVVFEGFKDVDGLDLDTSYNLTATIAENGDVVVSSLDAD